MAVHHFQPTIYHTAIGPHAPVLRITSGDTVITTTVDNAGRDAADQSVTPPGNPQTGPFFIADAEPGDTLAVRFDRIWPNRRLGRSSSVLAPHVVDPSYGTEMARDHPSSEWEIDPEQGMATLITPETKLGRLTLPLAPMLGCFGVAPPRGQTISSATSDTESLSATITLTMPLYQSGSVYSKLRQAKQTAAKKRFELEQARRKADEAARRTWESLTTVQARIESIRTLIVAAETALEGVKREAAVGSRTVLDVLDAEQELLDARVDLVRGQRDEMVAAFALKAAVGQLTASALKMNVNYYNPDVHYREVRGKFFGTSGSGE